MKRRLINNKIYLLIFSQLIFLTTGCDDNSTSPIIPLPERGSWTIYTPYDWFHDGKPYQSSYCTIYSDVASQELKQQLGAIADQRFSQILQLFNFQRISDFRYPPNYSKIEIYVNRNHPESINWAYWGGFIFTIRTSDISGIYYDYAVYTFRHELEHVFEFLIEGREVLGTEVWFKEGIAVHIGCMESNIFKTVETVSELEAWISQNQKIPGQGNPIAIHHDYPAGSNRDQYYKYFELAVRYLLDSNGMGKSYQDVLNLFYDLRNGISFSDSFENHFGISINDYEADFYDLMRSYLGDGR